MQQTVKCPNCGSPNTAGQKFCGYCGAPMGVSCPNCGASLDAGDRFCGNCGAQMPSQSPPQQQAYRPPQQPPPPQQPQNPYNPQQTGQQWNAQQGWGPQQQGMYGPPQGGMSYQGAYGGAMPRRQSRMPLVILLVVLIIALGGFAYWAFMGSPPWSGGGTVQIKTGPFIQAVSDNSTPTRDITITWETNTATTGKVDYGADTNYGSSSVWESGATTSHSINLSGLTPETRYHYRLVNKKNDTEVPSGDYTFSTPQ
jgi:hypothetical protein